MNIINDKSYVSLISELKDRVLKAQIRAHRAVNIELIKLYWEIGKSLSYRMQSEKWGSKYLEQVSKDLKSEFPGMKGFSKRNLEYMRKFYSIFYAVEITQQPAAQLGWSCLMIFIDKKISLETIDWYSKKAIQEGWSRNVLSMMIKQDLYARQKLAPKITKSIQDFINIFGHYKCFTWVAIIFNKPCGS